MTFSPVFPSGLDVLDDVADGFTQVLVILHVPLHGLEGVDDGGVVTARELPADLLHAHAGDFAQDKLTVVALDGYRLAIVERPVEAIKEIRIIVPSKTMNEVSHLLANDDEETVHISANRRYVVFTTAGYTIMSRLIEGEFLNYHNFTLCKTDAEGIF